MKKIIIVSVLSLMSSVYALEVTNSDKPEVKAEIVKVEETKEPNNKSFLYEFDFSSVGKADKSIHKYMTNNTDSVATVKALEDIMKKNWNLSSDYSKNLKLKSENKVANGLVCKYNSGLVIKIKAYGDYSTNCPLKS